MEYMDAQSHMQLDGVDIALMFAELPQQEGSIVRVPNNVFFQKAMLNPNDANEFSKREV